MNFLTGVNSKIREAMAGFTSHPEYEQLPESVKHLYTPQQYAWLGTERDRVIERETQPDMDYSE
jgi:hypothetical protein